MVFLALLAQLIVIYVDFGDAGVIRRVIFPASYVFLLAFVILNRRRIGLLVIGVGALLNFLAIVTNGGLMPISPDSLEAAGLGNELAELELGDSVPDTKDVLLAEDDIHLEFLSDRITWGSPGPLPVFSIGDVVIGAGLLATLGEFLFPLVQRSSRGRPSLT